jgi:2-polyprenyl-3-methyl-5-hydroxy-6-metoxy-1,4-benzoquinol methylase
MKSAGRVLDWPGWKAAFLNFVSSMFHYRKVDMKSQDSDRYWQFIGDENPYWGVVTHDKFQKQKLTLRVIDDFYSLGEDEVRLLFQKIHRYVDELFVPESALDFGCGVGRVLLPLAKRCRNVVGVDVSDGMLQKARERCESLGVSNVELVKGDDRLSGLTGSFDLIHSYIVFQHIAPERGYAITDRLVQLLKCNGVGILHYVYLCGIPPKHPKLRALAKQLGIYKTICDLRASYQQRPNLGQSVSPEGLEMQMHPYNLTVIFQKLQSAGVGQMHVEFTNHAGFLGVVLFFKKSADLAYRM